MLRNVIYVLVLAAFAATSALASPVPSANAHRRAQTPLTAHPKPIRPSAHPAARHETGPRPKAANHNSSHPTPRHPARKSAHAAAFRRRQPHFTRNAEVASLHVPVQEESVSLRSQRFVMPAPLRGSLESLTRQNDMAEAEGLERILDEDDLNARIAQKLLVPVPVSASLAINQNLPENRRYCRVWTANFLSDLASAHAARFHKPIDVSRSEEHTSELESRQ